MEEISHQLRAAGHPLKKYEGEFENFEASLHEKTQQATGNDGRSHDLKDFLQAFLQWVPLPLPLAPLKPVLKGGVAVGTDIADDFIEKKLDEERRLHEADLMYDQIADLTRAFVDDLDRLAENAPFPFGPFARRKRQIILFFDAFDHIAADMMHWLLDHFLKTIIDENKTAAREHIVLVIASHKFIQRLTNTADL